ncbi:hypothetical protein [Flavobacterium sp. 25HG05S-40]|uniref:hypothetical protein n=1 Tax=Flavobacterium sp. 25HG05S-40 TaxID=3458682 RepID=UPI004044E236
MKKTGSRIVVLVMMLSFYTSCTKEEYTRIEESPVVVDLTQVPYPKLSDYKFFEGDLKNQKPSFGVLPYQPISELFTDYAQKKRFVWLPSGTKAIYNGDGNVLNLPVGAALIKNFYYTKVQPNNSTRIIETRIMIRKSNEWIFAEYVWNEDQSEAFLTTQRAVTTISWRDETNVIRTINYKIPSVTLDCIRCHGLLNGEREPIGIKPQNINSNFSYSTGAKNQLQKLIELGYLEDNLPNAITTVVDYKDTTKSIDLRARSYFDSNCAHCHKDGGEAEHFSLRFAFNQTTDIENMGVSMPAEHSLAGYNGRIVYPNNVNQSILHYRVNTETDNFYMMPPLGRTIKHDEGVHLLEDWINSL